MADDPAEAEPKDSFDEILKRVVTGDATPQLAPDTVISDRFRIERMIGIGGMGAVYVARDQTLGREVAIKLHHTPGGAFRLRREAIAMARLAHPNVVTVFEVGELDRFPFVVMEYVPGTTLRAWLAETPRTVTEILEIVLAAGDGLAAAHDAGLIHRDIKPENVLIGTDGRARVGDFGLARELDSQEEVPTDHVSGHLAPMTQTGAVLGTPAYMAPEQLTGEAIDSRADQFAFCVTLWEALWGERPYAGATMVELERSLTSGKRREPPALPKVPRRFRQALERGLAPDREARFPSMHALLDALRAPRRRRKRVVIAIGLGIAAASVASYFALHHPVRSCETAGDQFTSMLPVELPTRLLAMGADHAAQVAGESLEVFGTSIDNGARAVCEAEAHHELTPQLLAKSNACFGVAARTARDLLRPPHITAADLPNLVQRARAALPSLASCSAPTFLASSPAIPDDPVQLAALIEARVNLGLARAELSAHRTDRALVYLALLDKSPLRDSPLIAPSLLEIRAADAMQRGDTARTEKLASDAYYAARGIDDDAQVAEALEVLLTLAAKRAADDPASVAWLRTAIADTDRMSARAPWLAAALYLDIARVAEATDDPKTALRYLARFRALANTRDAENVSRADALEGAIDFYTGKGAEGVALYERAIASATARLGADDPEVGGILADYAASLLEADRLAEALATARRALAIVEKSSDPTDEVADRARVNLAAVLADTGNGDEARPLLELARSHYVAHGGAFSAYVANVDVNLSILLLDANDTAHAISLLEEALATDEHLLGHDRVEVAEVLYNLAVAYRKNGELQKGLATSQRCAQIYRTGRPGTDRYRSALLLSAAIENDLRDHATALSTTDTVLAMAPAEDPQILAWTGLERGRALIGLGRGREARPILEAARAAYVLVPLPARVEEVDRLLARTR